MGDWDGLFHPTKDAALPAAAGESQRVIFLVSSLGVAEFGDIS